MTMEEILFCRDIDFNSTSFVIQTTNTNSLNEDVDVSIDAMAFL